MTSWRGRANDFYQRFESSLDVAALPVTRVIFAIRQEQNISDYALLFATCALLAAATLFLCHSEQSRGISYYS
jgi:hypothetical protein